MFNQELLRVVDTICREKNIEKDMVFEDLESAMLSAARKAYGTAEDVRVTIDRTTGEIAASRDGVEIDMKELGRIAAQTAKQVMIQKFREAERDSIFDEYSERVGQIITGTVSRYEGRALIVHLGRVDAILPRSEQIPGESHHPGERVRAMILDVREAPNGVRIILTRSHPDYIRRLFELEVPEVGEKVIEIKALAREAGYRTKVAVASIDTKVDAVGACVGVRGSRIRNIVDELGGEKIDIVRWNESSQILISNALKPAEVQEIALCFELGRASVVVSEDQLSLAIGKRGQNVRLAARLTGWDVDIVTPAEYNKSLDQMESSLKKIEGVEDIMLDRLLAMGIVSLADIEEVGAGPLVKEVEMTEELAERVVSVAAEEAKRIAAETQAAKELAAANAALAEQAGDQSDNAEPADGGEASEIASDSGGDAGAPTAAGVEDNEDDSRGMLAASESASDAGSDDASSSDDAMKNAGGMEEDSPAEVVGAKDNSRVQEH